MKKLCVLLLYVFLLQNTSLAQKLSVESFALSSTDITAQTDGRKDLNGDACALVKINFVGDVSDVEGNVIKPLVKRGNETWVYMTQESQQMKVITKDYLPLMVTFGNYGIDKLQSNRTYVLTLAKPSGVQEPVDAGGNFYAISVQPKDAKVTIDGVLQESSSDGEYSAMLAYGSHTYKVEAGGYISKSGSFAIGKGDMTPISVSLVSAMATLSVSCPTPAVSLYVDKKSVGSLPWNGSLKEGMHLLEVRKNGYRSQQKTIQLAQQQKLDVAFDALSAIQGNLSVNFKPFGSDVYVDGVKVGQSPHVFNGVLIGNHEVEICKSGYNTSLQTVTISEGQTASVSGVLKSTSSFNENVNPMIYDVVEDMPSFPGGAGAMMSFIRNNIKYPYLDGTVCVQGRVIVSFVVECDGSVSNVKVTRSVDEQLDKEAIRVVKSMPKWIPGKQNGRYVRVKYTVPVTFRLQ